jgi:hypothetical protein
MNHEQKERLMNLIKGLPLKKHQVEILRIIKINNPELEIIENDNGIMLFFDNLTEETYVLIKNYMYSINEKNKLDTFSETPILTSENDTLFDNKIKYTNKEKTYIKTKLYNEAMKKQNAESSSYINKKKLKK